MVWFFEIGAYALTAIFIGMNVFGIKGKLWWARMLARRAIISSIYHSPERWKSGYRSLTNDQGLALSWYVGHQAFFDTRLRINDADVGYWYGRPILKAMAAHGLFMSLRGAVKQLTPPAKTPLEKAERENLS